MSSDDAGRKGSRQSLKTDQRSASTKKSEPTVRSMDGKPAAGPDNSTIISTSPDFVTHLLLKLAAEASPARLGKFVVQKPDQERGELRILMVIRDDWLSDKADCLKLRDLLSFSLDKVDMHHYKTHEAIGIEWDVPLGWIKGFQWATEEETEKFFDIHAYKEPN